MADAQKPVCQHAVQFNRTFVTPYMGKMRSRCGVCAECLVKEDSGHCPFSGDKPKFGGPRQWCTK